MRAAGFIFSSMETLKTLLPDELYFCLNRAKPEKITEIRLRAGKPAVVYDKNKPFKLLNAGGTSAYISSKDDLNYILGKASGHSMYAINDSLIKGYLSFDGGIRIGVCGEGVTDGSNLTALKNISSMTVRIPHQIFGCADGVIERITSDGFRNTLIISPPCGGKTTMLREIARLTSNGGKNVLIIDERNELSAPLNGVPALDVGVNTDVICGVPKLIAYENTIRAMNPDVIITDEIYTAAEAESLLQAVRSGVKVAASMHADSAEKLKNGGFGNLLKAIDLIITLSKTPAAGTVKEIEEGAKYAEG